MGSDVEAAMGLLEMAFREVLRLVSADRFPLKAF